MTKIPLYKIKELITFERIKSTIYVLYFLLFISVVFHFSYARRIIPGVKIGSVRVGGMTYLQAIKTLEEHEKTVSKELILKAEDREFIIKASDINLVYDWDASVSRAFEVGRTGNIFIDNKDKIAGFLRGLYIGAFYEYDDNLLASKFSLIKAETNIDAQNAGVGFDPNGKLIITPPREGLKVIDDSLHNGFASSFDKMDFQTKVLPTKKIKPKISEDHVKANMPMIEKILSNEITIKNGDKSWVVNKEQLLSFLELRNNNNNIEFVLNEPRFEAFSESVAQDADELPRGKVTSVNGERVLGFELIKDGKELDKKKFADAFRDAVFHFKPIVELPMIVITGPANKEKYGILSLLGEGVSTYKGSGEGRIHNLLLAAERTDGVLVAPGAVYSMNAAIGDVSYETGYDFAYIIKEGRTVLGAGGGVCQTSTTLFRAVLDSGLPIITRHPHAYRVSYYEQNMPVGFDAAVFQPSWDFQFKNDTNNYVLIQTSFDKSQYSLTFRIYGTPDGREVEISEPVITNQTPPPPALYQDDPTLNKGVVRQVDFPAWGANVSFSRKVTRNNELLFEDIFNSRYQSWRAVYLVGTKE